MIYSLSENKISHMTKFTTFTQMINSMYLKENMMQMHAKVALNPSPNDKT